VQELPCSLPEPSLEAIIIDVDIEPVRRGLGRVKEAQARPRGPVSKGHRRGEEEVLTSSRPPMIAELRAATIP
jgi:hypothetical protein